MLAGSGPHVGSLYVHVPFCARKCEYCAFYSEAAKGDVVQRYVDALIRELEIVAPRLTGPGAGAHPDTIFFGGGTPSLLTLSQWSSVLQAMDRLRLRGASEWTIECNPATVSFDKASLWREYGVNRVSMGVQSLDEALLDRLGRVHSRDMVFRSFDLLRKAGFDNLNVDLMFGIPGQTLDVWRSTLDEAAALGSEHLSSYEVIYEDDTPLFEQMKAGEFEVDEELACAMYEELIERSAAAGFRQYEVANFARDQRAANRPAGDVPAWPDRPTGVPAFACRHNLNYWHGGAYFGLGPSAAGYVDGVRTRPVGRRLAAAHDAGEARVLGDLPAHGDRPRDHAAAGEGRRGEPRSEDESVCRGRRPISWYCVKASFRYGAALTGMASRK